VTFNETVSNILSNPGHLIYMVVNPRQYALYHIKKRMLSNVDDILPLVFSYCEKIQASFDYFYDFDGRKRVRIIRLEDLLANELGVTRELYKFAGYKWRGVNAQDLQKWAEKYQLEPNEWRTALPFDLVDTIDNYWQVSLYFEDPYDIFQSKDDGSNWISPRSKRLYPHRSAH